LNSSVNEPVEVIFAIAKELDSISLGSDWETVGETV
jgi:hypothetical protein